MKFALLSLLCLGVVRSDDLEYDNNGRVPSVSSSHLQVHIPKSLTKREPGYRHREAFFGIPPYGGSIQQKLIYANDAMCEWNNDVKKGGFPQSDKPCSFVQKARNAQKAGAAGVIFADNRCTCEDEGKGECQAMAQEECEAREPIMADDGSGSDITIPSLNGMEFASTDPIVQFDLWTTPTEQISKEFQLTWRPAVEALQGRVKFTPHMYLYDGIEEGCREGDEDVCDSLCSANGRYCAADPDGDLDHGISGLDVVRESLRRECIWNIYGKDNKNNNKNNGEEWWKYVENFLQHCDSEPLFSDVKCIGQAMLDAGIEPKAVADCEKKSGSLDDPDAKSNNLLNHCLVEKEMAGVVILPTAYVNQVPLRGELEFATVFKAVCNGYERGTMPDICTKCSKCGIDEYSCVLNGQCPMNNTTKTSVSKQTFAISMGVMTTLFVVFLCVGLVCLKRHASQMRQQVAGMMAKYKPIDNKEEMS
eukprot:CAMPEP_0178934220 /NCGR_PEP_ID=MMETSP0786-20121207/23744_1 /TAXON_ID=186022 /ORGANISM="Thalassionema frauenfeldii, Strain CCMP 1798" /LENGTH=476 /DNA_ID=CAMNT_0020611983 /DNA_START=24 /DNA_END=1452 /DNA_ORIENTATION=+